MAEQRELTPAETRILEMLKTCEEYFDNRKLTVKLEMTKAQLLKFREGNCKAVRYEADKKKERFTVYCTPIQYWNYTLYCADMCGMKVFEDGTVLTYDGLKIENKYLGRL